MKYNRSNAKCSSIVEFDEELIFYIADGQNDRARPMLNEDLAKEFDDMGTLLHYAASYGNSTIISHLLELGAEINSLNRERKTPLMLAVEHGRAATAEILLEAGANFDIVNADGRSALHLALDPNLSSSDVVKAFVNRLQTKTLATQELAERLVAAGGNMYHAAMLEDVKLLESMLEHGIDINSRGVLGKTALHAVTEVMNCSLAIWLLHHGADVNAVDKLRNCPLLVSTANRNNTMIKILLEKGADPNCKGCSKRQTPLCAILKRPRREPIDLYECVELLLRYGAIPRNISDKRTIFDHALLWANGKIVNMLVSHLALLEMLGTSVTKSVMFCGNAKHQLKVSEFEKFHEMCLQVLKISAFQKMTLLDLFNMEDHKMKLLVRKETFFPKIKEFCSEHKLSDLYSYYYEKLMKRITAVKRVVNLEDEAIPVICDIFNVNYNLGYNFARIVVSFLNVHDLQQLVTVS